MDWNEFLREAVAEKDADLVRQALAQGADPNLRDKDDWGDIVGKTALFWAVSRGRIEIARLLLEAEAQVAQDEPGDTTSLYAAVQDRNLPMVNLLLEYDGSVALEMVELLLSAGADPTIRGWMGIRALDKG